MQALIGSLQPETLEALRLTQPAASVPSILGAQGAAQERQAGLLSIASFSTFICRREGACHTHFEARLGE